MKQLIALSFFTLLLCASCSNKKSNDKEIPVSDSVLQKEVQQVNQEVPTDTIAESQIAESQQEDNSDAKKYYNSFRNECNAKHTYCKSVIIGTDTIFFTTNDVNKNGPDNYMLPYELAKKIIPNGEYVYPHYSVAVIWEKNNMIAITVWEQGDCVWLDKLLIFEKTTGKLISNSLIASNGCGEFDQANSIIVKGDSLFVSEITDTYHPEVGYLHSEYKTVYIISENGVVEEKKLLSAPDRFINGKAEIEDSDELQLFRLLSYMSSDDLKNIGIEWENADRKYMLCENVELDGRLIKSAPKMRSISYSNYNLEVDFGTIVSNFHLYRADDEREFLAIAKNGLLKNSYFVFQRMDSAFVIVDDFLSSFGDTWNNLNPATVNCTYSFNGDEMEIKLITTNTVMQQANTIKFSFNKEKGIMEKVN